MTKNIEQDVAFIRALAELMRESDLGEIEVEREYGEDDEIKVRLSRSGPVSIVAPAATPVQQVTVSAAPAAAPVALTGPDLSQAVTSPMVGTVYLTPDPTSAPFVQVGDTVSEGQTLVIIEAMKTMNQIPSTRSGVVRQILVGNAEPVEFGAPLMIIA